MLKSTMRDDHLEERSRERSQGGIIGSGKEMLQEGVPLKGLRIAI
ncbi:MAG TPA: hypothetical protein VMF32_22585 [Xanthobacteraceae bacterium]|nr:hypothetical protein [Xanthobacteraceae bacterium]